MSAHIPQGQISSEGFKIHCLFVPASVEKKKKIFLKSDLFNYNLNFCPNCALKQHLTVPKTVGTPFSHHSELSGL